MNWAPIFIDRPVEIFFTLDEWVVVIAVFFFSGSFMMFVGLPFMMCLIPTFYSGAQLRMIRKKKGKGYIMQNLVYRIPMMESVFKTTVREPHKNRRFSP